jgi:hypothetical protein
MNLENIILEILRSWPLFVFIFVLIFKKEISMIFQGLSEYAKRMKIVKGDLTIESQQKPEEKITEKFIEKEKFIELEKKLQEREELIFKYREEKKEITEKLKAYEKIVEEQFKMIRDLLKKNEELNTLAKEWFFNFLNLFLVPHTKRALFLFKTIPMNKESFKKIFYLPPEVPNQDLEKETIFNVLLNYRLIEPKENFLYHISPLGEEFLKFIGYIK